MWQHLNLCKNVLNVPLKLLEFLLVGLLLAVGSRQRTRTHALSPDRHSEKIKL